jgi:hypothetical protein
MLTSEKETRTAAMAFPRDRSECCTEGGSYARLDCETAPFRASSFPATRMCVCVNVSVCVHVCVYMCVCALGTFTAFSVCVHALVCPCVCATTLQHVLVREHILQIVRDHILPKMCVCATTLQHVLPLLVSYEIPALLIECVLLLSGICSPTDILRDSSKAETRCKTNTKK